MVVNERPSKRMKRRVTADLCDFLTFPEPGVSASTEPFRNCVQRFLSHHARITFPPSLFPSLMTWQILFRVGDLLDAPDLSPAIVTLDIVEEDVTRSRASVYCDQCRVVGWSGHPVCRKRYHFIIRAASDAVEAYQRPCSRCGNLLQLSETRKVSVMDLSKKFGLEYRLLHAITNGHSWYGNWGYEFGTGSYALTQDAYKNAVNTLSSMPLSSFSFHGRGPRSHLECVISLYQSLAETELLTIGHLFSFMLTLIHECLKPVAMRTSKQTSNMLCAWTGNDVEEVQHALIKVLLASGACTEAKWVTRRALKGAVCRGVSSPELLDYCLKHFPGKLTANGMIVCSRCNPISSGIEFRLEPWCNGLSTKSSYPTEVQLISDLTFLFNSIIHPDKMVCYRPKIMRKSVADSARKLLDCKQFMKDYKPYEMAVELPSVIRLWCHVELSDQPKDDPSPPPELIMLPLNATVADLRSEATSAFQEVYAMYKRFQAEELLGYGSISDSLTIRFLLGTSGSIQIQGKCPAKHGLSRFRMERGTEVWKVDCTCGAKDDDGEKMLACDTCGVWQHTRCAGIDNNTDGMPSKFVCMGCVNLYREETKKLPAPGEEANETCKFNTSCRDEAVARDCATVSCNIAVNFGVG
ncbi:PHD finger protein At1g33420-like isoform X3 [Glycine soja]|uniref:PHD finger protein isoform B n=1 Tax=Glycine soja TaxID=3848 RepID=A0A445J518_GLYSO|nr:PHD finger protein At1g33420-like isoform X3 [Glycine soja]RZB93496.1 PHD finger protein isoform B [Glycine soja]